MSENNEYRQLHEKVVWAYLASDAFKAKHPRKWAQFQKEPKIKNALRPTPEEFNRYEVLTNRAIESRKKREGI